MSGEQVAVDAMQRFPMALVVQVPFHPARDDSHLQNLPGVGFLNRGRKSVLHFGEPLSEEVTVTTNAARVISKRDRAVELALPHPVDLGDVAKQLGVDVV